MTGFNNYTIDFPCSCSAQKPITFVKSGFGTDRNGLFTACDSCSKYISSNGETNNETLQLTKSLYDILKKNRDDRYNEILRRREIMYKRYLEGEYVQCINIGRCDGKTPFTSFNILKHILEFTSDFRIANTNHLFREIAFNIEYTEPINVELHNITSKLRYYWTGMPKDIDPFHRDFLAYVFKYGVVDVRQDPRIFRPILLVFGYILLFIYIALLVLQKREEVRREAMNETKI